ncbi:MAG: PQQ-dependent sugar dehydrogenase [Bdellovibrionales bacterium]|nr:PQQ-dependent sugar dehydrogenase [Bdellovibrionales bacterium]
MWRSWFFLLWVFPAAAANIDASTLKVPHGFKVSLYASVPNARQMALGPDGIVFVGSNVAKHVFALKPKSNGRSAEVIKIGRELVEPNGVAFKDGDLYVAEIAQIWRFPKILDQLNEKAKFEKFGPLFPRKRKHGWRVIAFGPDGWLYTPVGAPCDACEVDRERFALFTKTSPDGTRREVIARGVRNSVGYDWSPRDGKLWFTENGRSGLGEDLPPDELNRLSREGEDFGFPHCYGKNMKDPELGKPEGCAFVPPVYEFQAHSAMLGMRFIRTSSKLKNSILVAQHGSVDRKEKVGYQVVRLFLNATGDKVLRQEPFLSGFLKDGTISGRPVDVLELKDGSILVSDDFASAVYRIYRTESTNQPPILGTLRR